MGLLRKSPQQRVLAADLAEARAVRDANADLEHRAGITYQTTQAAQLDQDVAEAAGRVKSARRGRT